MKVYKYLSPDRTDILENKAIRFTQAKYLNDPFESLPFISKLMSEVESSNLYNKVFEPIVQEIGERFISINNIPEEFRDKIPPDTIKLLNTITINQALNIFPGLHPKNLIKILLSSPAAEAKVNYSEKLKESWNNVFCILSLTQTNDNITMWSHYAQNHEGFVIEFDPENSFFNKRRNENDVLGFLREVKYSEKRPEIELITFQKPVNEMVEYIAANILYTKSKIWSDEKEMRLVYNSSKADKKSINEGQDIYLFHLPPSVIKSIFVGVNANDSLISKIENTLKNDEFSHVHLFYGQLDLKHFKINFD